MVSNMINYLRLIYLSGKIFNPLKISGHKLLSRPS